MNRLTASDALDAVEGLIASTASVANKMAEDYPYDFERLNASTGIGIRLLALKDAKAAIITAEIERHEHDLRPT